jgi:hypothetical protein
MLNTMYRGSVDNQNRMLAISGGPLLCNVAVCGRYSVKTLYMVMRNSQSCWLSTASTISLSLI